ncbi:MAG: tyrosine recombinase [Acetobacteraceae bacterium]|nr:tyrosine recombinase [Acetobacteraceae bacterium]
MRRPSIVPPPVVETFLEMMAAERGASRNTLAAYEADLIDFARFCSSRGVALEAAATDDLRAYLHGLYQAGLSPRTAARRLSALRQFHLFLLRQGLRADDPTEALDRPQSGRRLPKVLSEREVADLLAAAGRLPGDEGLRARALLELLYATGLRVSELVTLPRSALRPGAEAILVRGKGGRERLVPLGGAARSAVEAWLARLSARPDSGPRARYLFPSRSRAGHLTRQAFGLLLKQVARAAGLDPDRVSPHVLRHAFASHLLARGADLRSLQAMLGHADIATTEIYTHLEQGQAERAVAEHHPLARRGHRPEGSG